MLGVLLAKDLRRARRNPLPWLINIIVPLAMTALIGLVFGRSNDETLGRIRFAVVDEDRSALADLLRGSANQQSGAKYLEPMFLEREEALRLINANEISAVLIIPTNFMRNYLMGSEAVGLELIKNPAESVHPAVLEELLGALVTALNAISRNFAGEFPEVRRIVDEGTSPHELALLAERVGNKLSAAKAFVNPPLISYEKNRSNQTQEDSQTKTGKGGTPAKSKNSNAASLFAFLLIGLCAMFLLFLANNAMTDLHREIRIRTFERYQTLHDQLWPFILSKVVFAVVVLSLGAAIMLGGGGLIFGIGWRQPVPLMVLTFGYTCFVAAFFAVTVALVPDERRAGVLNNIAGMALGLAGGCAFPARQLPVFLRDHVTPWLPSFWYVQAARDVQFGNGDAKWGLATFELGITAAILIGLAAVLFRNKFRSGVRP